MITQQQRQQKDKHRDTERKDKKQSSTVPAHLELPLLMLGIVLIHFAVLKPVIWGLDGNEVLHVAHSLVTHHSFSVPADVGGMIGADGQTYSTRYLLLPVLIAPLMAIAVALSPYIGLPGLQIAATFAVASSVVLIAATALLVACLALRLGSRPRAAYLSALCYAFGTIALTYAQTLFSEPLLGFWVIACIYLAFGRSQRAWLASSLVAALAILTKPVGVVLVPLLSLYFLAKRLHWRYSCGASGTSTEFSSDRPLKDSALNVGFFGPIPPSRTVANPYNWSVVLSPLVLPALGVLGYCLYNYARFGELFETGQPTHYALTSAGMISRFFGFLVGWGMGGGLIWYCPPVVLAVFGFYKMLKAKPLEALVIAGTVLSFLWIHAFWWCCGWDWGPRFLVPILPLVMALTAFLDYSGRRGLVLLSALGGLISAPTLVSFYQRYYWEIETTGADVWALSLWTSLADAPITNIWGVAYRQISAAMATDVQSVLAAGNLAGLTQIVPVWWWMLPLVGVPVWIGAIAAALLAIAGIVCLTVGWQRLPLNSN